MCTDTDYIHMYYVSAELSYAGWAALYCIGCLVHNRMYILRVLYIHNDRSLHVPPQSLPPAKRKSLAEPQNVTWPCYELPTIHQPSN